MRMLFWTVVLAAAAWYILKNKLGPDTNLVAHLKEQQALQTIGDAATQTTIGGNEYWPLSEFGVQPLSGVQLDPFNSQNPFTAAHDPQIGLRQGTNSNPALFY